MASRDCHGLCDALIPFHCVIALHIQAHRYVNRHNGGIHILMQYYWSSSADVKMYIHNSADMMNPKRSYGHKMIILPQWIKGRQWRNLK